MLRRGEGEPLILFHGILCGPVVWREVVPLLAEEHEVLVPTALGHRGGSLPASRPVTIHDVVDEAERQMDEVGLRTAHLAGNSLGGWMALELARRGRARSVCALSPAGLWKESWEQRGNVAKRLLRTRREAALGRLTVPFLGLSARFRRWALQGIAVHGDRVRRDDLVAIVEDAHGCSAAPDLLRPGFRLESMDAPCPVTIAWAERDRLFPLGLYRDRPAQVVRGARFEVLEGVGHTPMLDDPQLVARVILAAARRSASPAAPAS